MSALDFNKWMRRECGWANRSFDSDKPPKLVRSDNNHHPWKIEIATADASKFMEMLSEKFGIDISNVEKICSIGGGDYSIFLTLKDKNRLCRVVRNGGPDL